MSGRSVGRLPHRGSAGRGDGRQILPHGTVDCCVCTVGWLTQATFLRGHLKVYQRRVQTTCKSLLEHCAHLHANAGRRFSFGCRTW